MWPIVVPIGFEIAFCFWLDLRLCGSCDHMTAHEPYVCEVDELVQTKDTMGLVCAWGPMSAGGDQCADKRLCQCIAFGKSSHGFRFVLVLLMCPHDNQWDLCNWCCRWVGSHKRYHWCRCVLVCPWVQGMTHVLTIGWHGHPSDWPYPCICQMSLFIVFLMQNKENHWFLEKGGVLDVHMISCCTDLHWSGWLCWTKRYNGFRFVLVLLMCPHASKWALCVCDVDELIHKKDTMDLVCAWGPMCTDVWWSAPLIICTDVYWPAMIWMSRSSQKIPWV